MMLDAALQWAQKGFFIFPCVPLGKEPATTNGFKDATRDPDVIRAWWTQNPHYNIGVSPDHSGMFVLDVDPPLGAETLASLELEHGLLPRTLTFKTPRGGTHLWFKGKCASSQGRDRNGKITGLGPKVDTRGCGGYVLLSPSRVYDAEKKIDGNYQCTDELEIANGPGWIAAELGRVREEHAAASNVELDVPANVERADQLLRQYVSNGDVAVSGAGGNDRTYQLACEVLNLGLRPETAFERMRRIWNPACEPPWDSDDLAAIVAHAAEYSQNDMGAWAVKSGAETFADFASSQPVAEDGKRSRYYPYELAEIDEFQPPEWLIADLIPKRGTVQITGKQKSFKTFLTLDMVLGLAAKGEPIVYIAGENASALVLNHVPAWCLGNDEVAELLPFRVVREMPHAVFPEQIAEFIAEIKRAEIKPSVVVIDTATRALRGLDENSSRDMGQFSAACEMIQRELDCTVIVIRHTGKDEKRGGRGSNVIEGDFDTIISIERDESEEGRKSMYVKMTVVEQRNAAEREHPLAFEMVPLGQSLIARAITAAEHSAATRQEDPFDRGRVGAALGKLGATSIETGVRTYILAMDLTPAVQGETAEMHEIAIKRTVRQLKARAKTSLAAYVDTRDADLVWFAIPNDAGEASGEHY